MANRTNRFRLLVKVSCSGAQLGTMVRILASRPSWTGSIPNILKKISEEKIVDATEVNQLCYLEEIRQRLENVDRTHLVLACGMLVLTLFDVCVCGGGQVF